MSLHAQLQRRAAEGRPVRVGLIGAGKFGSMYLAQVPRTPGVHLAAIADLAPDVACANLARVGWPAERAQAPSIDAALKSDATHVGDDWRALVSHPAIDVVVECTGHPPAAVEHCLAAFAHGKHVVNVTVEADAFCGPLLARKAAEAGVVYSLAFGDQPALICDLVDWARTCGFPVVAAGRGHKWLPHFAQSTPDTVWGHYGLTQEQATRGGAAARARARREVAAAGRAGADAVLGRRADRPVQRGLSRAPRHGSCVRRLSSRQASRRARASSSSRSRRLRVSDAARSNSARASSSRPSFASRSPRTLGSR
jgi:predicted homoserine dehydrogenase-like protein